MRFVIALGSNCDGRFGAPRDSLLRALSVLRDGGCVIERASALYRTPPAAPGRQPDYLNAAVLVTAPNLTPRALLRLANRIEREAGRHPMRRRGPRPLDLDIIAAQGARLGWPRRRGPRPPLVLPHPLAHTRTFVLRPAVDLAPCWHHLGTGLTFGRLYRRLERRRGALERIEGPEWAARALSADGEQRARGTSDS